MARDVQNVAGESATAIVTAWYPYILDGAAAGDQWVVWIYGKPPVFIDMIQADGIARLAYTFQAVHDDLVRARVGVKQVASGRTSAFGDWVEVYASDSGPAAVSAKAWQERRGQLVQVG